MPAIGGPELVIILIVALVLLAPRQLAGLGRSFGGALRAFKRELSRPTEDA